MAGVTINLPRRIPMNKYDKSIVLQSHFYKNERFYTKQNSDIL